MNYYIITGASKGLGASLAEQLLREGNTLVCVSRTSNADLLTKAEKAGVSLTWIEQDLSDPAFLEEEATNLFPAISDENTDGIYLINNAGRIEPIGPIGKTNDKELIDTVGLNVTAPAVLSSWFVRRYTDVNADKAILNISSGLGTRAMYGVTTYCLSKAALNMLTRSMAVEQEDQPFPVRVLAVNPGMTETPMQEVLRNSSPDQLPNRDYFREASRDGSVVAADKIASVLVSMLHDPNLQPGKMHQASEYTNRR
jgi:benzil reductase ((S)-benzoin forming)